ncbi:hypothetical protein [Helicobacter pylori]
MRQKKASISLRNHASDARTKRAIYNANAHVQNRTKNAYKRA